MEPRRMRTLVLGMTIAAVLGAAPRAGQLDPKALSYTLPADIKWVPDPGGTAERAALYGDPNKPGAYAFFIKWKAGNMSRPHFHENTRYIVVMSGTWWVGTGAKFDPASTVPMPAGTWVVHTAREVHYDGAKQGDTVLLIHGVGPAASIPAEQR